MNEIIHRIYYICKTLGDNFFEDTYERTGCPELNYVRKIWGYGYGV